MPRKSRELTDEEMELIAELRADNYSYARIFEELTARGHTGLSFRKVKLYARNIRKGGNTINQRLTEAVLNISEARKQYVLTKLLIFNASGGELNLDS
jgi:exoribonuclease II